jgi:phosphoglycolate phosphatase
MSLALVFDLDGTLVDSAPDIAAVANAVLRPEGAPPLSLAEARGFVGGGAEIFVRRMMAARSLPEERFAALLAAFLERYEGAVAHSTLYPGVLDALSVLAAKGHPMAICTNKPIGPARIVLDHFGLARRFAVVIGGDSLPVRKPDPAPLHAALDALSAQTGLMIGDSEVDAEASMRASVPFALFTEGYRKAPAESLTQAARFSHFDRLPEVVAELSPRYA